MSRPALARDVSAARGPVVVKLGGRTFEEAASRARLASEVAALARSERVVVVHGGGSRISAELGAAGVEPRFVRGLRVTDARTMEVVERVLTLLGKELASAITAAGTPAVGLTGRDAALLVAAAKDPDLGRVGEPTRVDAALLDALLQRAVVPVLAPVAVDASGAPLNVNADEAAGAVARALRARALVLMTDVDGVLGADGELLPRLAAEEARGLVLSGVAKGGMVPKIEGALATLAAGVGSVWIVNGASEGALASFAAGRRVGTEFVP